ncbi:MAG: hypothetical protein HKP59_11245 [Lutibacter sp.]|uniref:hypothetical protein n=1 Tax=Lutibacter sp. TaxID=1925666 RepID=UPI0017B486B6|nr:hypothetical protein [Lutibacter sp.]MBT8318187.1 hypothetical protein [Lutibacter sp.]NNJ59047.1 hypothetical protein [Lutibacter sp.]
MKKFKVLALALFIGTGSLFAANGDNFKEPNKEIRSQIVSLLKSSVEKIDDEMSVNITFTFSSEGEIVVLNLDTKDADVLNYVRENLNYKKVDNPGVPNRIYSFHLKCKTV